MIVGKGFHKAVMQHSYATFQLKKLVFFFRSYGFTFNANRKELVKCIP